jgi:hypothetical protein
MDNHPIPQDVTGFQFRLIGDMTVKQFGYLAAGVVLAWITYELPIYFLIKYPLILLFGGLGASLAFLPIEGRPMDIMIFNFIKAIFNSDQYVYQKHGGNLALLTVSYHPVAKQSQQKNPETEEKLQKYLSSLPHPPKNQLDEKEQSYLSSLFGTAAAPRPVPVMPLPTPEIIPPAPVQPVVPPTPVPQPKASVVDAKPEILVQKPVQPLRADFPVLPKTGGPYIVEEHDASLDEKRLQKLEEEKKEEAAKHTLEQKAEQIKHDLDVAKLKEQQQKNVQTALLAHQKALELENQLQEALVAKKELEDRLLQLSKKVNSKPGKEVFEATDAKEPERKETQNVRRIPKSMGTKVGLPPASDVPNVIIGIIKDSRGNILPNILVEIKDKAGHPVRAFKTNMLGQFASATPLSIGTFTIDFEDPQGVHKFDSVALNVKGEIIQPLEVISTDAREELRRDLFGTSN